MRQTSEARREQDDTAVTGDVAALVETAGASAVDCVRRSAVFQRMADGTLPFAGRAAYLEQHWEGLRILHNALSAPAAPSAPSLQVDAALLAPVRSALRTAADRFAVSLDRAHATARWRDRHVTMPSMLQFRRHIAEHEAAGDILGLVAQAHLRLVVAGVCPSPGDSDSATLPADDVTGVLCDLVVAASADTAGSSGSVDSVGVRAEEQQELLSEELSAALLMLMQHGSDVCRAYQERDADSSCAVTVSTIRRALR